MSWFNSLRRNIWSQPALAPKSADGRTSLEILSAMANAYGSLVDLLGHKAAASFLRGHADHIAAREGEPVRKKNIK